LSGTGNRVSFNVRLGGSWFSCTAGELNGFSYSVYGDSNEALNLNDDEIQQFIESNDNKNTSRKL
jgi:uncharacterized protein YneR